MKILGRILLLLFAGLVSGLSQSGLSSPTTYTHTCDASAAVALDEDRFVVANDEDNVLRIYSRSRPGPPVSTLDVTGFLQLPRKSPEADLEGAARVGSRIFWISSHGTVAGGKVNPHRQTFFSTDIRSNNKGTTLVPVGGPYKHLLRDLIRDPKFSRFNFARAAETDPEKPGALNIEGLCATPEGHLLIGFRTPIPQGSALLVPLLNPDALTEGRSASFGEAILLDLGGFGIRSLDYHDGKFWIIAGHYDNKAPARLYMWAGGDTEPQWLKQINLAGFNPEAMIFPDASNARQFQIISDDGGVSIGGQDCKDLKDPNQKRFRCFIVTINNRATDD